MNNELTEICGNCGCRGGLHYSKFCSQYALPVERTRVINAWQNEKWYRIFFRMKKGILLKIRFKPTEQYDKDYPT